MEAGFLNTPLGRDGVRAGIRVGPSVRSGRFVGSTGVKCGPLVGVGRSEAGRHNIHWFRSKRLN